MAGTQGDGDYGWGYLPSINLNGAQDILVEQNSFSGCGYGVVVTTEPSAAAELDGAWVRDNVFEGGLAADVWIGSWSSTYRDVNNVYVTNNTIIRLNSTSYPAVVIQESGGGVDGESMVLNNVVISAEFLLSIPAGTAMQMDYNAWGSGSSSPFFVNGNAVNFSLYLSQTGNDSHGLSIAASAGYFQGPGFSLAGCGLPDPANVLINAGATTSPSWWSGAGAYSPCEELDIYQGARTDGTWSLRDIGADECEVDDPAFTC